MLTAQAHHSDAEGPCVYTAQHLCPPEWWHELLSITPISLQVLCHPLSHNFWKVYYTVLGTCNLPQLAKVKGRDGPKESEQGLFLLTHGGQQE